MMDFSLPRIAAKRRRRDGPAVANRHVNGHSGRLPRSRRRASRSWARISARIGVTAVTLAGLVALSALAASDTDRTERVAVVMDGAVAHDPARRAAAEEWLRAQGVSDVVPRVAEGPTQQLSVTSTLAVRGYDVIVAVGLDRRVAIDPVVR